MQKKRYELHYLIKKQQKQGNKKIIDLYTLNIRGTSWGKAEKRLHFSEIMQNAVKTTIPTEGYLPVKQGKNYIKLHNSRKTASAPF